MKSNREYRIPYLGLKLGHYQYHFVLTDKFFEEFEFSEIHSAQIEVEVNLERKVTMLVLDISMHGTVFTSCDRCGDSMELPLSIEEQLIVKFGEATGSLDEEVLVHGPAEHEIDLIHHLYEYAHLALPQRKVHPSEEDCNQEALKILDKLRVEQNANTQWAALKNLDYEDPEEREDDETDKIEEED